MAVLQQLHHGLSCFISTGLCAEATPNAKMNEKGRNESIFPHTFADRWFRESQDALHAVYLTMNE